MKLLALWRFPPGRERQDSGSRSGGSLQIERTKTADEIALRFPSSDTPRFARLRRAFHQAAARSGRVPTARVTRDDDYGSETRHCPYLEFSGATRIKIR
jgi:hypothetical protein